MSCISVVSIAMSNGKSKRIVRGQRASRDKVVAPNRRQHDVTDETQRSLMGRGIGWWAAAIRASFLQPPGGLFRAAELICINAADSGS